jgi:hypothetical protein
MGRPARSSRDRIRTRGSAAASNTARRSERPQLRVGLGRARRDPHADRDAHERDGGSSPELLPREHGEHRGDGSLGRGDRGDHADLADRQRAIGQEEAADIGAAGGDQPAERRAVEV